MNTVLASGSSLIVHINPSPPACPNHASNDQGPGFDMLSAVLDLRLAPQASPLPSRLAPCSHRIGFTFIQADSSASGCFPPRLAATQFPLAAEVHDDLGLRLSRAEFMYVMTHWAGDLRAPADRDRWRNAPRCAGGAQGLARLRRVALPPRAIGVGRVEGMPRMPGLRVAAGAAFMRLPHASGE
jgi:hypothetical protein